jgi:membrane protein DedA with SNARE-associated domain
MEDLVSTYGYMAIVIGTFLEGETILIIGGFAAHRGYLELPWVMVSAFFGTLFGDQLYFYIGWTKGRKLIDKRPVWKAKSNKVFALLNKHQLLLILGFRFLYGLRTVTPFILGVSKIPPLRFLILNVIGASIWAVIVGFLGYVFGHTLETLLGDIRHFEGWIIIGMGVLGATLFSVKWYIKR